MKVLLLVPHTLAQDREQAIDEGRYPRPDYDTLADRLRCLPQGHADILDRGSVARDRRWLIRLVRLVAGDNCALALLGFLACRSYDVVFSHAENVGKPFALLLSLISRRPRHVMCAYYVTGKRNKILYRYVGICRHVDALITFSRQQYNAARSWISDADRKLFLIRDYGFVDVDFFRRHAVSSANERQVCAVGRESRDYATLFKAVATLPQITLKVEGNSPWSVHRSQIEDLEIPRNVQVCELEFGTVYKLYAESAVVAVPLRANRIGAGLTTLVEAMAIGKPVIITSSDHMAAREIEDGVNACLVREGDVEGWRDTLSRLLDDPELRARLVAGGRQWVEQHASRERWLQTMLCAIQGDLQPLQPRSGMAERPAPVTPARAHGEVSGAP